MSAQYLDDEFRFKLLSPKLRGGIWYAKVKDEWTGEIYIRATGFSQRERVARWAEVRMVPAILEEIGEGEEAEEEVEAPTFAEGFAQWRETLDHRPSTQADYDATERLFGRWFGEISVDEMRLRDLEPFFADLRERGRKARTRNKYRAILRAFFRYARNHQWCDGDPSTGIPRAKLKASERVEKHVLTAEEARELLRVAGTPVVHRIDDRRRKRGEQRHGGREPLREAIALALYTGLRRANVLKMRWEWVATSRGPHGWIEIPGESMKAGRDHAIPLHEDARGILDDLAPETFASGWVLGQAYGDLGKGLEASLARAGLPRMRWHWLRDTFATWMSERASVSVLQTLMGHSPSEVTFTYIKPHARDLEEAIGRLPHVVNIDSGGETRSSDGVSSGGSAT